MKIISVQLLSFLKRSLIPFAQARRSSTSPLHPASLYRLMRESTSASKRHPSRLPKIPQMQPPFSECEIVPSPAPTPHQPLPAPDPYPVLGVRILYARRFNRPNFPGKGVTSGLRGRFPMTEGEVWSVITEAIPEVSSAPFLNEPKRRVKIGCAISR